MSNGCQIRSSNSSYQTCVPSQLMICLSMYVAILNNNSLLSKLKTEAGIVLGGNAIKKSPVDTHRGGMYPHFLGCFSSHEFLRNIPILLFSSQNRSSFCYCEGKMLKRCHVPNLIIQRVVQTFPCCSNTTEAGGALPKADT
jgi:hypothetical protein